MENWKDIKDYEGLYQVSNLGRVKSLKFGKEKILKIRLNTDGYVIVTLSKDSIQHYFKVHRLVAQTFIPNPDNLPVINHKSGIKNENNFENLEWVSSKENVRHAFITGLHSLPKGIKNSQVKLTEENVFEIRKLKGIKTQKQIAKEFNVSQSLISLIFRNKNWTHI